MTGDPQDDWALFSFAAMHPSSTGQRYLTQFKDTDTTDTDTTGSSCISFRLIIHLIIKETKIGLQTISISAKIQAWLQKL